MLSQQLPHKPLQCLFSLGLHGQWLVDHHLKLREVEAEGLRIKLVADMSNRDELIVYALIFDINY